MSSAGSALVDEGISGRGSGASEYFPSDVYPAQASSGSWWEQTNWFRSHRQQPSNQPPTQLLTRGAADPSALLPASASSTISAAPATSVRPPYHHEHSDVVEYGGLDGAVDHAYRAHLLKSTTANMQIADAPGHATCFNRFATSKASASGAAALTSTVKATPTKKQVIVTAAQGYAPSVVQQLQEYILLPLLQPTLFSTLGIPTSRGVLLAGSPGSGKSRLIQAMVSQLGLYFHSLDGANIAAGDRASGGGAAVAASDDKLTVIERVFAAAKKNAPALIFIDELDAIALPRQPSESPLLTKLRAVLRQQMDALASQPANKPVIVVGATSTSSALCASLLRPGRFERTITLNKPDEDGRKRMLQQMVQGMKISTDVDLVEIAKKTEGFVGSDLMALCKEAGLECVRAAIKQQHTHDHTDGPDSAYSLPAVISLAILSSLSISQSHFLSALTLITPASSRTFAPVPPLSWQSVGGNEDIRSSLTESIQYPLIHKKLFKHFNLPAASSTLLYGPPGCGKTMMARVIAHSYGVGFISVKGPELLSSYLGESERKVRELFSRARAASPCVIFFDELDALATRRGQGNDPTIDRIINSLLVELDAPHSDDQGIVFVIAATNRPELLDPAILRPGRFDHLLYVPLPDEASRREIVNACIHGTPLDEQVDGEYLMGLASRMAGFSGADIANVLNVARKVAVKEELEGAAVLDRTGGKVTIAHLETALHSTRPSVTPDMLARYSYFRAVIQGIDPSPMDPSSSDDEKDDDPTMPTGLDSLRQRIRSAVTDELNQGKSSQQALNAVLFRFMNGTRTNGREEEEEEGEKDEKEEASLPTRRMISGMTAMQ